MSRAPIDGNTLIGWGFKPGKGFTILLAVADDLQGRGKSEAEIIEGLKLWLPPEPTLDPALQYRTNTIPFGLYLDPETDDEINNLQGVVRHMDALMRTPTIVAGAVMPDACPSGSAEGTIPVGGVVATKDAIHPGFHSADICCSMAITVFKRDMDVERVMDLAMGVTHFGAKHRDSIVPVSEEAAKLIGRFGANPFMAGLEQIALGQIGTQGDGNHFFYVGHLASTGQLAIVTHHGSRNVGGQLYKRGMAVAKRHTSIVSPRTPEHNAWIDANSKDGEDYWDALQLTREWTKLNHFHIHDWMQHVMGNAVVGRFWNEHNFVFRKSDGLFYHGKGATPSYAGFSADDSGQTLIPLNMGQPILIAEHVDNPNSLGFAPHGAGRNLSRTEHMRRLAAEFPADARGLSDRDKAVIMARETAGIDVRFFCGHADMSELPSAYKNPHAVREQIERHQLARIVDEVLPGGSIMAGDLKPFWKKKKDRPDNPITDDDRARLAIEGTLGEAEVAI